MNLDFSQCRLVPVRSPEGELSMSGVKAHAKIGVGALIENPFFFLADEMGGMKTAQTIITAQFLYQMNIIDKVLVIAPASVRSSVWFDKELGELGTHLWFDTKSAVYEYHAKMKMWKWGEFETSEKHLQWMISNYEFIRSEQRLVDLLPYCTPRTLMICDESSAIKNHKSKQFKACFKLRKKCGRIILLNGTPIANSPLDMFAQGNILDTKILDTKSYFVFRARYAIMGGFLNKEVKAYQNLEDLQNRFKPYILRRLKRDCLDLPPALPPVTLTVNLTEETWKLYKQMRDDMVTWLSDSSVATASQAIVKSMRLAQLTAGFLGGVEEIPEGIDLDEGVERPAPVLRLEEIGREKLDFLIDWHKERLVEDPDMKLLVWFRFIPELSRFLKEYKTKFPKHILGNCSGRALLGGTQKEEREAVMRLLNPRTAPSGPVTVGGTYGTGSLGHNFTACHTMFNASSDYSYWKATQAAARIDRPGQVHSTSYFDLVAVGPKGQKTIDHVIVKARRGKEEVANWTTSAWIKALTEE